MADQDTDGEDRYSEFSKKWIERPHSVKQYPPDQRGICLCTQGRTHHPDCPFKEKKALTEKQVDEVVTFFLTNGASKTERPAQPGDPKRYCLAFLPDNTQCQQLAAFVCVDRDGLMWFGCQAHADRHEWVRVHLPRFFHAVRNGQEIAPLLEAGPGTQPTKGQSS